MSDFGLEIYFLLCLLMFNVNYDLMQKYESVGLVLPRFTVFFCKLELRGAIAPEILVPCFTRSH